MQRLYSSFARGWPGAGLLLLRLAAGIPLVFFSMQSVLGADQTHFVRVALDAVGAVAGIFLMFGLLTPVAGAVVALTQLLAVLSQHLLQQSHPFSHLFLPVLGAALAMLGPGAWSIDARLFGRKRLIPPSSPLM